MEERGPKLVSISLKLPYDGVDHAGGELLLHHYRVLAKNCARVDAFATEATENMTAVDRSGDIQADSYHPVIVHMPRWRKSLPGKVLGRLWAMAVPVLPDLGVCTSFTFSKQIRARLRAADLIELQWFEYFFFGLLARRLNPSAQIVGFAHDIPSQKIERSLSRGPKMWRSIYLSYVAALERLLLSQMSKVVVLSDKDAGLVSARSVSVNVVVINPPINFRSNPPKTEQARPDRHSGTAACFGFVGALHRPENDDAALWLLSDIWPPVLERCPDARLYIIGSKPSKELQRAASTFGRSVTVTGYVTDLDICYELFDTIVVPLRYGAGVKFKTISGILAGKNIIGTHAAIEGILPEEYFFRVSDSAEMLSDAMIMLATNPALGRDLCEKARSEVGSRYSIHEYARSVLDAYGLSHRYYE